MAEKGLNIQSVKDKTTLSRTTISNLYNNYGSGIQYDTLKQLCNILRCQPGDLLTYVEIEVNFEDITINPDIHFNIKTHITDPAEGDGYSYISDIQFKLEIECEIVYSGSRNDLRTFVELNVEFSEDKTVYMNNSDLNEFISELNALEFPHYVEEYILNEINVFIEETAIQYSSDIEIKE